MYNIVTHSLMRKASIKFADKTMAMIDQKRNEMYTILLNIYSFVVTV